MKCRERALFLAALVTTWASVAAASAQFVEACEVAWVDPSALDAALRVELSGLQLARSGVVMTMSECSEDGATLSVRWPSGRERRREIDIRGVDPRARMRFTALLWVELWRPGPPLSEARILGSPASYLARPRVTGDRSRWQGERAPAESSTASSAPSAEAPPHERSASPEGRTFALAFDGGLRAFPVTRTRASTFRLRALVDRWFVDGRVSYRRVAVFAGAAALSGAAVGGGYRVWQAGSRFRVGLDTWAEVGMVRMRGEGTPPFSVGQTRHTWSLAALAGLHGERRYERFALGTDLELGWQRGATVLAEDGQTRGLHGLVVGLTVGFQWVRALD